MVYYFYIEDRFYCDEAIDRRPQAGEKIVVAQPTHKQDQDQAEEREVGVGPRLHRAGLPGGQGEAGLTHQVGPQAPILEREVLVGGMRGPMQ